jgi:ATP-dependent DNA helicase PIF1
VPAVGQPASEASLLAAAVLEQPILTAPNVHSTPLNEHAGQLIAIDAFPTLFFTGEADFNSPREIAVTESEWAGHLMRLSGGRFAQHNRFRYWALNTIMRHKAKKASRWYATTHRDERQWTIETVRQAIADGQGDQLAGRISRYAADLEGTRPFWTDARGNLLAQIRDPTCGPPHLFFTFSAADVQWPDLHRLMPGGIPADDDEHVAYKKRLANLNSNPALAAHFFHKRFEIFFEDVICRMFKVTDHWWRFEWQHRGSSHIHGFLWIEDAPNIEQLKLDDPESIRVFIAFWDPIVSTWNPGTPGTENEVPPSAQHPSAMLPSTLTDSQRELAQMLNRVQRHTKCAAGYCLRRHKTTGEEYCRFKFPFDLSDVTFIKESVQKAGVAELITRRNDALLNIYIAAWTLGWRANSDSRPIQDVGAPVVYASKYISKAEPTSATYLKVLQTVISHLDDGTAAGVAHQKLLSAMVAERDISAQEVCHILLGLPLWTSSRQCRSLSVSQNQSQELDFENPTRERKSVRQHYEGRPDTFKDMSLLEFAHHVTWKGTNYTRRGTRGAKPYIVKIYPRPAGNPEEEETFEKHAYAKLILHHPHTSDHELLGDYPSWTAAYRDSCLRLGHHHPPDTLPATVEGDSDDDDDEGEDIEDPDADRRRQLDWMLEAGRAPNAPLPLEFSRLGERDVDRDYDWHQNPMALDEIRRSQGWLREQKAAHGVDLTADLEEVDWRLLRGEQRILFLQVVAHYKATLDPRIPTPPPLYINIDGTAGTGKSFLIAAISTELKQLALAAGHQDPVLRAAPTGIAAFNIRGTTLHTAFRISPKLWAPLKPAAADNLQRTNARVKVSIFDEKSMMGQRMLGQVDSRSEQIYPDSPGERLGGRTVLLFGDFAQLPPVGDRPLFAEAPTRGSGLGLRGRHVYETFQKSITLRHVFRQAGADEQSIRFREALLRLRTYSITQADYELLATRFSSRVSEEERTRFSTALRLFPRRESVSRYNLRALFLLGKPVVRCMARHTGGAENASEEDAEGLEKEILLSEGAAVMLTKNLWTPFGK